MELSIRVKQYGGEMRLLIVSSVYVLTVLIKNLPSIIMALAKLIETLYRHRRK